MDLLRASLPLGLGLNMSFLLPSFGAWDMSLDLPDEPQFPPPEDGSDDSAGHPRQL